MSKGITNRGIRWLRTGLAGIAAVVAIVVWLLSAQGQRIEENATAKLVNPEVLNPEVVNPRQVLNHTEGFTPANVLASAPPLPHVRYSADVSIDPVKHLVSGTLTVRYEPKQLGDRVYFHLYPNIFRDTALLKNENWKHMLGDQQEPGQIVIQQLKVRGQPVPVTFHENDPTILQVMLPHTTTSEKMAEIEIGFLLKAPHNNGRMSYNEHALWLGNWLPIIAMKDSEGWRLDPYYPIGDPFNSDVADYQLTVVIPEGYELASTGAETAALVTNTRPARQKSYQINVNNVRDFAIVVMDSSYQQTSTTVGKTVVRTWAQEGDDPEWVNQLHQTAVESFRYYSTEYGEYPYSEYDLVKTGGFFGGMEYPGIVFIQGDLFNEQSPVASITVAHETAHQWFYGLVGNDEVREAWVDEALTDYAAISFFYEYNSRIANGYLAHRREHVKKIDLYLSKGISAWQPLDRFPDWQSYSDLVYSRGATMLWELRESCGEKYVNDALRSYVRHNLYKRAGGREVIAAFNEVMPGDATPFFAYWLRLDQTKKRAADEWLAGVKAKFVQ